MSMTEDERKREIAAICEHLGIVKTKLDQYISMSPEATGPQRAAVEVLRETRAYVRTALQVVTEVDARV